jgi:hypothetical protein
MEIVSKPTAVEVLTKMAVDSVYFAQAVSTDYDPRPCQCDVLRAPLDRQVGIAAKARQTGFSETLCHWAAWALLTRPAGFKIYIIAPNEFIANENLERIYSIYESTELLRDNLRHANKTTTAFKLNKVNKRVEVLLVGSSGGDSRRGISIRAKSGGLLWFEELDDIEHSISVSSTLTAATAWAGGTIYVGTRRGFTGPMYSKYQYIKGRADAGYENYRVWKFPLIQFIAERNNGVGIRLDWLREKKHEEPHHVWLREYCGQFAEPQGCFFDEQSIRNAWLAYEAESIQQFPFHDKGKQIVLGIDWGLNDRTVLCYAADDVLNDRLEVIHLETMRKKEHCKGKDKPIENFDAVVKLVCNLRERGLDPVAVYCDKNNKGGVFSDRLANEHHFNVIDASWNSNTVKTQCLRSLSNLLKSERFIFPQDERVLNELTRYNPEEHSETGKYVFRDKKHKDDVISAMAQMSTYMARESQPPIFSASCGESLLTEQDEPYESFAMVY